MLKYVSIAALALLPLLPSASEACSVTIGPDGQITSAPQNATPFSSGGGSGGGFGRGGGGQSGGLSLPQIGRNGNSQQRVGQLSGAYSHMLDALDPDLKKPNGDELDPYEKTVRFQNKLSDAAEVMHALDTAARLQTSDPDVKPPTEEEIRHAEEVLTAAILELQDDVPDAVRAQILHDPRKIWIVAISGLIAFAIGSAVLYCQKRRQAEAA